MKDELTPQQIREEEVSNEILAENLKRSVQWHKEKCNNEDCGVSLFLLGKVYEKLIGRNMTREEFKIFF